MDEQLVSRLRHPQILEELPPHQLLEEPFWLEQIRRVTVNADEPIDRPKQQLGENLSVDEVDPALVSGQRLGEEWRSRVTEQTAVALVELCAGLRGRPRTRGRDRHPEPAILDKTRAVGPVRRDLFQGQTVFLTEVSIGEGLVLHQRIEMNADLFQPLPTRRRRQAEVVDIYVRLEDPVSRVARMPMVREGSPVIGKARQDGEQPTRLDGVPPLVGAILDRREHLLFVEI